MVEVAAVANVTEEVGEAVVEEDLGLGSLLPGQAEHTVEELRQQFSLAWSSLKHVFTVQVGGGTRLHQQGGRTGICF